MECDGCTVRGERSFDAVVIGSGYGGSVAACRLSTAGAKVCLVEKGRRWSPKDFPTSTLGIVSAARLESARLGGFGFGSRRALFQVHEQGDSLCCVACGLGGGSLVGAGVLLPTPALARKSEGWPAEWNRDWELCQATASAMLGAGSSPVDFTNAKVTREISEQEIEKCTEDSVRFSVDFGRGGGESPSSPLKSDGTQAADHCVACGNCSSGCPYGAKNSTDKNYLALAIQAGCVVKTECEALYVIKNPAERTRRWRVHFDDLEYISADFVVLSGKDHQEEVELEGELHLSVAEISRTSEACRSSSGMAQAPYPPHILHKLRTGDGQAISCRQWKCKPNTRRSGKGAPKNYPVLLLNGHSTESYCLPTEPKDLVRTLLEEGHETWVLQPRLHPLHASNNFTIEDVAKFDIPAVIARIQEVHDPHTKIHVIAHCVGGLAIHMAVMGGFVPDNHIASLSCTNSSMFFKLTTLALIKMKLPLLPVSMAILGKNTILSMFDVPPNESKRHRLLKSIARLIPRREMCTLNECNVFSGIFGNTFWHENISESMHEWLNKESLPRLPMSAFPHLRRVCRSGFIVDRNGRNEYLIHPERMALPTLYISGGRSILVTPETTFLAHKYMKLHQPMYRHKRIIVDGFGHSDLLIGEDAHKKVFPYFVSHIQSAEDGESVADEAEYKKNSAMLWDGAHDGDKTSRACKFFMYLIVLIVIAVLYFSY